MDEALILAPDDRAPHSAWMEYAIGRGMPAEQARGMTRDQLRICFLPSAGPIGSEPDLERFEQDPETVAARREARRTLWERP
jgi:hypothetical protein